MITKYGHVKGELADIECFEAGHPVPDENSVEATKKVLELVEGLKAEDTVLFLLSGGGSALFEKPLVDLSELQDITGQLLASGADISEINCIRKRLSEVKGGRFAQKAFPAKVYSIILSDIVGDPLDMIASGPTVPDGSTCEMAREIACGAAGIIDGLSNVAVFSVGSDGTDGPTDAAGGYVDGSTMESLRSAGVSFNRMFDDNDCYHILETCAGLIKTGPTGTNVNDFSVVLIDN